MDGPKLGVRIEKAGGRFASDVLKLAGGAALAQVVSVLVAPLISRLYGPDVFGVSSVFNSIVTILGVVACARYELAIMLPRQDEEAVNLLAVSLYSAMGVSALIAALVLLGHQEILRWLKMPALAPYLWLVPLAVLINGAFRALG